MVENWRLRCPLFRIFESRILAFAFAIAFSLFFMTEKTVPPVEPWLGIGFGFDAYILVTSHWQAMKQTRKDQKYWKIHVLFWNGQFGQAQCF